MKTNIKKIVFNPEFKGEDDMLQPQDPIASSGRE